MKITRQASFETIVTYTHEFENRNGRGGFSFPCSKDGEVFNLSPEGSANYSRCLTQVDVIDLGIARNERYEKIPAQGLCVCGETVTLGRWTCSCDCGRDYNSAGQELAPREQWGEETGETYSDLQSVDSWD